MTRQQALDRYRDAIRDRAKAADYISIVRRFLAANVPWSREAITAYLRKLEDAGMKGSSVDQHMRTLRAFGGYMQPKLLWPGCDWSWDKKAQPSRRVAASPQIIARFAAALPRVDRRAGAWFTLAAIYGCRAGELAMWSARDLGPGEAVYIRREKYGESRWYWLPPQVRPHLERVLLRPMRRSEVYAAWRRLCGVAGVPVQEGVSWHSQRYAVVRGLRGAGVPVADVHRFLSWSSEEEKAAGHEMVKHYDSPTYELDGDGQLRKVLRVETVPPTPDTGTLRAMDARAWAAHPFLRLF